MQLCSNEEIDLMDNQKEKIPGFSFFGKRDMIQKQSVNSEFEIRKSSPFIKSNQSWVQEITPTKLNVSNQNINPNLSPDTKTHESSELQ